MRELRFHQGRRSIPSETAAQKEHVASCRLCQRGLELAREQAQSLPAGFHVRRRIASAVAPVLRFRPLVRRLVLAGGLAPAIVIAVIVSWQPTPQALAGHMVGDTMDRDPARARQEVVGLSMLQGQELLGGGVRRLGSSRGESAMSACLLLITVLTARSCSDPSTAEGREISPEDLGKSVAENIRRLTDLSFDVTVMQEYTKSNGERVAPYEAARGRVYMSGDKLLIKLFGRDGSLLVAILKDGKGAIVEYNGEQLVTYARDDGDPEFRLAPKFDGCLVGMVLWSWLKKGEAPYPAWIAAITSRARRLGTESINGRKCHLVETEDRSETFLQRWTLWIDTTGAIPFVVRRRGTQETISPSGTTVQTMTRTTDYTNVRIAKIPEEVFQVPRFADRTSAEPETKPTSGALDQRDPPRRPARISIAGHQ